ncbi:acyl carrier protein [Actinoplanes sp. NPDC051343]|jgi:acyl carrier protein|uniref:acyl carrier protein n=1 Tax=Actinoplanes sp. NPDC051343 TaxID=3363906 RepID=UPI0037B100C8
MSARVNHDTTESVVLSLVRELAGNPAVNTGDDLFELGFDSLMIVVLAARIQEQLDVELPIEVFFDAETIADLVAALRTAGPA